MKCLECGKDVKSIGYKHLKSCSGITTEEYKKKHPGASLVDVDVIAKCVHYGADNASYKPEIHNKSSWERQCVCGTKVQHKSYEGYLRAINANSSCNNCKKKDHWLGKKHSQETKEKISSANKGQEYNKSRLGIKESEKAIEKRSLALKGRKPGFGNKKHSQETKLKMRLKRIEDMNKKYPLGWTAPNYNKKACQLFEEINKELGWNGKHAERVGEYQVLGYFLDYYEPVHNVVIEFDEKTHDKPKQKARDLEKQQLVTAELGCKFYRIKEGQENNWKDLIK